MRGKMAVPCTRRLFEAVEGLVQTTDIVRMRGIHEASGLRAVYRLSQGTMQERVLHIQLMNRPIPRQGQRQNSADGGRFDDRAEGLIKINTRPLRKATKNPSCFVSVKRAIRLKLVTKNLLAGNDVAMRRSWHKNPSIVSQQSCVLFLHGVAPLRIG